LPHSVVVAVVLTDRMINQSALQLNFFKTRARSCCLQPTAMHSV